MKVEDLIEQIKHLIKNEEEEQKFIKKCLANNEADGEPMTDVLRKELKESLSYSYDDYDEYRNALRVIEKVLEMDKR